MQCSAANDFTVFIYTKGVTIQPTYTVIIPSKRLKLSSENFPFAGKLWQNKSGVWVTVAPHINYNPYSGSTFQSVAALRASQDVIDSLNIRRKFSSRIRKINKFTAAS